MDRGRALLLAVACGVSVANVYYAQPLLGDLGAELRIAPGDLGLVTTITQVGYLLGLVLIVPLGDLVDRRRLIVGQVCAAAVALAVCAAAPGAALFLAAGAVVGGASVVVQVIVAFAAAEATPARRGQVVGTVTSGVVVGILLARSAAGLIADLGGWRAVYLVAAALMLGLAVVLARALPAGRPIAASVPYRRAVVSVFALARHDRTFRTRSLLALFVFGGFGAVWGSVALPLAATPWHLSPGQTGLLGLAGAAGALGAARAGRLADRGRAQLVTGLSLTLFLASWAAIAQAPSSLVLLVVGVVVLDFAGQAAHVTNQHLIVAADPDAASRRIGSYMVFYSMGTGGGALAATAAYAAGGWTAVCAVGAAAATLALVIWATTRSRPDSPRRASPARPTGEPPPATRPTDPTTTRPPRGPAVPTTRYRTTTIDGIEVFHREAGDPANPTILLLHGFPASSFMFRDLIARLADRFFVVAPDYPGFGHSAAPDRGEFAYTFDHLTDVVEALTERLGLRSYGLYLQDFGGPVGFRLAVRHPERVDFLVVQNANAYDEGLPDSFWSPVRRFWDEPTAANRELIQADAISDAALEWNYRHGTQDPALIDPDNWLLQRALLARPGNADAMLDLLLDYRTNPPRYPEWQRYLRTHQPPTLITWGRHDEIFPESGAHPYLRDLPDARLVLLETGHFALEEHSDTIAGHILDFVPAPVTPSAAAVR